MKVYQLEPVHINIQDGLCTVMSKCKQIQPCTVMGIIALYLIYQAIITHNLHLYVYTRLTEWTSTLQQMSGVGCS